MEEPDKAVKIEKNDMQAASAGYEYETLMRLMGVSVSKHLLDQHFTLIWANEFYYKLIGWPKKEYEERFHNRPDLYYADAPERLSDGLTAQEEKRGLCLGAVFNSICR